MISSSAEAVKERLPLETAVVYYTGEEPHNNKIRCPFHTEKTASFMIFPDNSYYCFGCGDSGDVITFTEKLFGISFGQALTRLNTDFGLMLPIGGKKDRRTAEVLKKQIEEKRSKEYERRKKLSEDYWYAFDYLLWLENNRRCCVPSSPDEMPSPLFLEALGRRQYTEYMLGCLENEKRRVKNDRHNDSPGI